MTLRIENSIFSGISKTGNGGVFEVSTKKLFVTFCFFNNITTTEHGGSIYCSNCVSDISLSCFYESYSTKYKNAVYGNAIFAYGNKFCASNLNVRKCGKSKTLCSDSSLKADSCLAKVGNFNSSCNYGREGCGGISYFDASEGSYVKYMHAVNSYDSFVIESSNIYTARLCNFYNNTGCLAGFLWQTGNNKIKFDSCIFILLKTPFSWSSFSYYAENCFADSEYASIQYKANPDTLYIAIRINYQYTCAMKRNRNYKISIYSYVLLICYS